MLKRLLEADASDNFTVIEACIQLASSASQHLNDGQILHKARLVDHMMYFLDTARNSDAKRSMAVRMYDAYRHHLGFEYCCFCPEIGGRCLALLQDEFCSIHLSDTEVLALMRVMLVTEVDTSDAFGQALVKRLFRSTQLDQIAHQLVSDLLQAQPAANQMLIAQGMVQLLTTLPRDEASLAVLERYVVEVLPVVKPRRDGAKDQARAQIVEAVADDLLLRIRASSAPQSHVNTVVQLIQVTADIVDWDLMTKAFLKFADCGYVNFILSHIAQDVSDESVLHILEAIERLLNPAAAFRHKNVTSEVETSGSWQTLQPLATQHSNSHIRQVAIRLLRVYFNEHAPTAAWLKETGLAVLNVFAS
eukprot:TRINITY_DN7228_c0_g1_i19.p3 TRINITY_DN7228_c0_g1~~TRINITY_DN7228_c0_g1_i19.p3  ORF type:complete len:362 (-),score=98.58 TRINITY_DN7228_c0_g1_i19:3326-4411(-)